jgi:polyisoprenoid-binding protein YceI
MSPVPFRLPALVALASLSLIGTAVAADVTASTTDVTFHISHPFKEYDAHLLTGGASIVGSFDPSDIGKTGFDVKINVDKFNSDNSRRDSHMMEVLEGLIFPRITWTVTRIEGVTGPIKVGQYKGYAAGPLTVREVTKTLDAPVLIDIAENGTVTVTSSFSISLEEFEIDRPALLGIKIENDLPIKVSVVFPGGAGIFPPDAPPDPPPAAEPPPEAADAPAAPAAE